MITLGQLRRGGCSFLLTANHYPLTSDQHRLHPQGWLIIHLITVSIKTEPEQLNLEDQGEFDYYLIRNWPSFHYNLHQ